MAILNIMFSIARILPMGGGGWARPCACKIWIGKDVHLVERRTLSSSFHVFLYYTLHFTIYSCTHYTLTNPYLPNPPYHLHVFLSIATSCCPDSLHLVHMTRKLSRLKKFDQMFTLYTVVCHWWKPYTCSLHHTPSCMKIMCNCNSLVMTPWYTHLLPLAFEPFKWSLYSLWTSHVK